MAKQQTTSLKSLRPEQLASRVLFLRGEKVMLDSDLAYLYGVETKTLNRAVRRNKKRFPKDFMFQLTRKEYNNLRYQFGTSSLEFPGITTKSQYGGRRYLPFVFTENGVAMLSSVLRSERAIKVNIQIMRMFTKLRRILSTNEELRHKIEELEKRVDAKIKVVMDTLNKLLIQEEEESEKKIGFDLGE